MSHLMKTFRLFWISTTTGLVGHTDEKAETKAEALATHTRIYPFHKITGTEAIPQLLTPSLVTKFRAGGCNDQGNTFFETIASGRSICRCCGKKISKGAPCFKGSYDFKGGGSWTSSTCYLHLDCLPKEK